MKQSDVLIRPYVTEKSMNHMSGTPTQKYKDGNRRLLRRGCRIQGRSILKVSEHG